MTPADEDKLRDLAAAVVAGVGYDLEELAIVAAGRRRLIRVVVDGDNGVSLDAAAELSRALSAAFDADGDAFVGSDPYTLEVTSPGIGRPLTEQRHFRRTRGRLLSVKLLDGSVLEGRVRRVDGDTLELLTGDKAVVTEVPLTDIRRAKVEVEFAKMPAAHAALLESDGFVDPARAHDETELEDAELDEAEDDEAEDDEAEDDEAEDDEAEDDGRRFFDGELLD
jgi:ribosome maturation factor RimP